MSEVTDDPVDLFWLTSKFYCLIRDNKDKYSTMEEKVEYYLQKEEPAGDNKLLQHLGQIGGVRGLPLREWFSSCYASILPESSFERIWDKVMAGSFKILIYTAVAVLLTFKRPLLSMNNMNNIKDYLSKVPEDSG